MSQDAANDLLMGGGTKSIGWQDNPVGHTVVGTIVDQPKAVQMTKHKSDELDFWPSGDPKMQIVVTIQTDQRDPADTYDDGKRRLHIPPRMMAPVREAVRRVGAPGLAIGGRIAVQRTGGTGVAGSPFEFAAEYAAPAVDPGSLLGPNGNGAQPAPAQAAPAAPMLTPQPAPMPQPVPATTLGSMLGNGNGATPAQLPPPPAGIDPTVWAGLPDVQRQAILAAMAPAGGGQLPPY